MRLQCPKGCERIVARLHDGSARFYGVRAPGFIEAKDSHRVRPPTGIAEEYTAMVALTSLARQPPVLEFYDDLHDVGGIFTGTDWAILVGVGDMQRIASRVLAHGYRHAERAYMTRYRGILRPGQQAVFNFVVQAATARCMAHELGHAIIRTGAANPFTPDDEAGADYYAGRLDAARGRDRALGEMFFWSIGCTGPSCNHPSPDMRAAAYRAGYDAQRAAA
jgi:hypothetical protein